MQMRHYSKKSVWYPLLNRYHDETHRFDQVHKDDHLLHSNVFSIVNIFTLGMHGSCTCIITLLIKYRHWRKTSYTKAGCLEVIDQFGEFHGGIYSAVDITLFTWNKASLSLDKMDQGLNQPKNHENHWRLFYLNSEISCEEKYKSARIKKVTYTACLNWYIDLLH